VQPGSTHHRNVTAAAIAGIASMVLLMSSAPAQATTGPRFLVASTPHGATVHARPGGRAAIALAGATPLGSPTWLWVVATARHGRWGRVVLPVRPNGRTGWIDLRGVRTMRTRIWVRASLRARRIWLMSGSRTLATYSAAIGAPGTETPTGRFSVTDRVLTGDPSGPFGWYAFGLSGHQPNLPPQWAGGDQLAIHGTNDPGSIGTAASHGCLRVSPDALTRLRESLQLGMPVVIMPTARAAMGAARRSSLPVLPQRRPAQRSHRMHAHPAPPPAPPTIRLATTGSGALAVRLPHEPIPRAPLAEPQAMAQRRFAGPAHRPATRTHATPVHAPLRQAG
jgi:lipoprotein-anchoring transpeptidase ErfK/SrfK